MMIDKNQNRIPCWIVYSLSTGGNLTMHAICLTNSRANTYRKALEYEENIQRVRIWIEASEVNHLFNYDIQNAISETALCALKDAWQRG